MSKPTLAADLVRGILAETGTKVRRLKMTRALERALGSRQAAHCQIMGYRGGRLVVEVDQAPLFAELSAFRIDEVRCAMNRELQTVKIAKIVLRMGGTGHV